MHFNDFFGVSIEPHSTYIVHTLGSVFTVSVIVVLWVSYIVLIELRKPNEKQAFYLLDYLFFPIVKS